MSFSRQDPPPRRRPSMASPLPTHSSSAVKEKYDLQHPRHAQTWIPFSLPIPGVRSRRLRIFLPNARQMHRSSMSRFGRKRGTLVFCFMVLFLIFATYAIGKRYGSSTKQWPSLGESKRTLVFKREDIQRIWDWEVRSGHYPSRQPISNQVRLKHAIRNPALPPQPSTSPLNASAGIITSTEGTGPQRVYYAPRSKVPDVAYPPRPLAGSVADLDVIMEHCDFSEHKYVRDCLEVLRVGAGLDTVSKRLRRTSLDDWKYLYVEEPNNLTTLPPLQSPKFIPSSDSDEGLLKRPSEEWEVPPMQLPEVPAYKPYYTMPESDPCDPESLKVFHMYWTGPFTDKPYLALLSFLYTQNHGLYKNSAADYAKRPVCRPQFWLWIGVGPAWKPLPPTALQDMYDQLKSSPWAAPFLHPRFKDVIKFKLWNTTEQLDGVPEIQKEWRDRNLFNSLGWVIPVPKKEEQENKGDEVMVGADGKPLSPKEIAAAEAAKAQKKKDDDLLNRVGSDSGSSYDQMSVMLSDLARFVLCYRYGGIYLDADTLFLRDWEELWGWKGAFAYRWSRLPLYNTAVLKMNKNSALGKFIFKTALKNGFDFHPMQVARYTQNALIDPLLLMLPDALFDSAWLNTEDYQMDRPPQPFFTRFADFFETPTLNSAAPQALGFDGFFKGAYSYHYHNFWWKPFDPVRNWPDLGPRFAANERKARKEFREAQKAKQGGSSMTSAPSSAAGGAAPPPPPVGRPIDGLGNEHTHAQAHGREDEDDVRDLSWATVMKRTFESYMRGEIPSMYGEWLDWGE